MEIQFEKNKIIFEKELNPLDKLVMDFTTILNNLKIRYVIVSGYVAILFGRSRDSEDIDIFIENMQLDKFEMLWKNLRKTFVCLNTDNMKEAFQDYLLPGSAIRFTKENVFVPNIECKFPKVVLEYYALKERKEVHVNNHALFISPLELQIPIKLDLGSEKDIEDAKHLYNIFKDKLDMASMQAFLRKLNIEERFRRYLQ